jgi:hypothetical protein
MVFVGHLPRCTAAAAAAGGDAALPRLATRCPSALQLSTSKLDAGWAWLTGPLPAGGLALPPARAARVATRSPQRFGLAPANRAAKLAFLTNECGLPPADAAATVARMPQLLGLALGSLRARGAYLTGPARRTAADIAAFPPALACSLPARTVPRHLLAAARGVTLPLSTMLAPSDAAFADAVGASVGELRAVAASDAAAAAVAAAEAEAAAVGENAG